ncbi:diguanylate cyclase [Sphingomicrobium sp. XHP0235]|uniref:sensor domain-containing diguanylate cyclase n=1 Tax=Sphingomicrobium aquimarinum TaxID=3133971 RepID=UPI0031FE4D3E
MLTTSLAYLVCAVAALIVTNAEDGIAAFWPASGVFVAGLLLAERETRPLVAAGVGLASLASNIVGGVPWLEAAGYTAANIVEGLLVLALMGRRKDAQFAQPATMLHFVAAAIVGGIASALMAGALSNNFTLLFLRSWATTVILGLATVTPIVMFIAQDSRRRAKLITMTALGAFLLVAALSVIAFAQGDYPLLFLPMVGLSIATALLGLSGSSIALGLVALIGSLLTAEGVGPVSQSFPMIEAQVLYFQAYIVALIVSVIPLAVLLTRHQTAAERNLELAETDALTGIAARRKILGRLSTAMEEAGRDGAPLCVAMIDIDHFKRINDRFGHLKGDDILRALTGIIRDGLGDGAELGRLGGEEFLAIFEGRSAAQALSDCEVIRVRTEAHDWPDDGPEQVTLSIGLADHQQHFTTPGQMLSEADAALYRAKDGGRNRCIIRVHPPNPCAGV